MSELRRDLQPEEFGAEIRRLSRLLTPLRHGRQEEIQSEAGAVVCDVRHDLLSKFPKRQAALLLADLQPVRQQGREERVQVRRDRISVAGLRRYHCTPIGRRA